MMQVNMNEQRLRHRSIPLSSRRVVSAANNARIHIMLGGSDVEGAGAGAGVGAGGRGSLPETQMEGVETECAETEEMAGLPGGARPIDPRPVFCELCELTRADSQPDGVAAADEALTWKEIARFAAALYLFIVLSFLCVPAMICLMR